MPLIVVTGTPCSGKTTRSLELKEYFTKRFQDTGQKVEIISEYDMILKIGYNRNMFYSDPKKEKTVRSSLRSDVQRKLDTRDLLIFDGSNYIKGYRYEIFCMTKQYKTPQCTLHCAIAVERSWLWNNKRAESDWYCRDIFDELVMRYEAPNPESRWDSPLFDITPEDELKYDEIYKALYEVASPKPNQSTQCPPLTYSNYLYESDAITQRVIKAIISAKQSGITNDVHIPNCDEILQSCGTLTQLMKLQKQFLIYTKMQQCGIDQIAPLFVQYLNKNL